VKCAVNWAKKKEKKNKTNTLKVLKMLQHFRDRFLKNYRNGRTFNFPTHFLHFYLI